MAGREHANSVAARSFWSVRSGFWSSSVHQLVLMGGDNAGLAPGTMVLCPDLTEAALLQELLGHAR